MKISLAFLINLFALWLWPGMLWAQLPETPVRIGVLLYLGQEEVEARWGHLSKDLANAIPGYRFEILPRDGNALREAIKKREIEFVLTNSSQYLALSHDFGVRRIATLKVPEAIGPDQSLGSAVIALANRGDLVTLADLRGKRIATAAEDAFGSYLAAVREIHKAGIDIEAGDAHVVKTGLPVQRTFSALKSGEADVAIVRTCFLEHLVAKGQVDIREFKIVGPVDIPGFRCASSTPLYPDWPMAVAPGVDPQLTKAVAVALLLQSPSAAGTTWDVPADYQSVHDLYRDLMIGPYAYLRETTLEGLAKRYRPHILVALLILIGMVFHSIRVETTVKRRTAELRAAQAHTRELEQQATHMARLSILGEMSGTLAHELNQPLATIATYAQGMERRCAAGPVDPVVVLEANREIVAQTERASQVIKRVRAFAKKRLAKRECKCIGNTVREAAALFNNLLPDLPPVIVENQLAAGTPIEADHLQLQEALLNLMKNAADAMEALPAWDRVIWVTIYAANGNTIIAVTDCGPPIVDETLHRLSEPFFTTKPDGLGLGVSICKSIAEAHGGRLEIARREPPPGLIFRLVLPDIACNG